MIDLARVHEREVFQLRSPAPLAWSKMEAAMADFGFHLSDDFADRLRGDFKSKWQTDAIASCHFERSGRNVYPDEEDFDLIRYEILVPWLPPEVVGEALDILFLLSEKLQLPVLYRDQTVSRAQSEVMKNLWLSDILTEIGDIAGSESAAILITMEYDRTRSRTSG